MSKSQSAPKISDVADPTMFLLVARSQWLNKYISPSLVYQKTSQPYDINYALIAIAVCLLKRFYYRIFCCQNNLTLIFYTPYASDKDFVCHTRSLTSKQKFLIIV